LTDATEPLALGLAATAAGDAAAAARPRRFPRQRRAPRLRVAELALGQREDALDAVQEAMIRLLRYRGARRRNGRRCSGASCGASSPTGIAAMPCGGAC
jgi:hypothetical protein